MVSPISRLRTTWRTASAANADPDDLQPMWPWALCCFLMFAAIALMFAGALYFAGLSHPANPSHPTIAEPIK